MPRRLLVNLTKILSISHELQINFLVKNVGSDIFFIKKVKKN
jgi:hypothetical protein